MPRKAAVRCNGKVVRAGRLPIPAEFESRSAAVRAAQEYFRGLTSDKQLWSEGLLTDRRRESQREIAD